MSDKSNLLNGLKDRILSGISRINNEEKEAAGDKKPEASATDHVENAGVEEVVQADKQNPPSDSLFATNNDEIDDGFIIDVEAETPAPKTKGLTNKQKLLLVAVVIVGGVYGTQKLALAPTPEQVANTQSQQIEEVPGPTFDLSTNQLGEGAIKSTVSDTSLDDLGFGGPADKSNDPAISPIGTGPLTADMNDELTALGQESNDLLDPFTGEVSPAPELEVPVAKNKAPKVAPGATYNRAQKTEIGLLAETEQSPFGAESSNDNELSGTKSQNTDSSYGVLQDQTANADVAILKTEIVEKDGRISKLETEVGQLKIELADAKQQIKPRANAANNVASKATQKKPAKSAYTAQNSSPIKRVAPATKAVHRPQICVTAIAQAARNCTTCVPHAFITRKGAEDMVGQGDYVDGLRVSIQGDRLDLQDANGVVVHKYWSSPNGCSAG
jgi:hypothetical protein